MESTIGTNPSDLNQYYGSVVAHGSAPDVLLTAFHENAHLAEINAGDSLSLFLDWLKEKISGGNIISAEDVAESIMISNNNIVQEYKNLVLQYSQC